MSEAVKLENNTPILSTQLAASRGDASFISETLHSSYSPVGALTAGRQSFLALLTLSLIFCVISFYVPRFAGLLGESRPALYGLYAASVVLVAAAWIFSGALCLAALREISARRPGVSLLLLLSLAALSAANIIQIFSSGPASIYLNPFSSAPLAALFISGLRLLDSIFLKQSAARAGLRIFQICPSAVFLDADPSRTSGAIIQEKITDIVNLRAGDLVRVREGGIIPADGFVVGGAGDVFSRRFSGVGSLKIMGMGQSVFGGSKVVKGSLDIKLESLPTDSAYEYFAEASERASIAAEPKLSGWASALLAVAGASALIWRDLLAGHGVQSLVVFSAMTAAAAILPMFRLPSSARKLLGAALFKAGIMPSGEEALSKLGAIKNAAVDYDENEPTSLEIKSVKILDERIDESGFTGLILAAIGSAEEAVYHSLNEHLRRGLKELKLVPLKSVNVFPGQGIAAQFEGGEFSLGTEDFLIARGVQLNPTEVPAVAAASGEERLFAALDDDVVAEIVYGPGPMISREMISQARGTAKLFILSRGSGAGIDEKGRAAGVELHQIYAALSHQAYIDKLKSLAPCAYVSAIHPDKDLIKAATASFSYFDELHWDQVISDFVIFEREPSAVIKAIKYGKASAKAERVSRLAGVSGILALTALGGAGILPPGLVLLGAGLVVTLAQEALFLDLA